VPGFLRSDRLGVVVSLEDSEAGRRFADRRLVLGAGRLVFHSRADSLDTERDTWGGRALLP
jgi:hypothetical protein